MPKKTIYPSTLCRCGEDTDGTHINFGMNTVSYINGKMYDEGRDDLKLFKVHVDKVLKRFKWCKK